MDVQRKANVNILQSLLSCKQKKKNLGDDGISAVGCLMVSAISVYYIHNIIHHSSLFWNVFSVVN